MLKFILIFSSVLMIVLGFTFIAMFNDEKHIKKGLGYYDMSMLKMKQTDKTLAAIKVTALIFIVIGIPLFVASLFL